MHDIQKQLLALSEEHDLGKMSLRQMARFVGVENKPQIVKHHLQQLAKSGLLDVNFEEKVIKPIKRGFNTVAKSLFYSLPVVGSANCGSPSVFADERVEGYLKVSSKMLPRKKKDLYVLIADGVSMNKAEIRDGVTIEDGDFVVVDASYTSPKDGDVVVAVIDDLATIKRYRENKADGSIILEADSTENFLPIFVHMGDEFQISGKVIDVIKKPKNKE